MDRLTTRNCKCKCLDNKVLTICSPNGTCPKECVSRRITKLCLYENTDLEPEEIRKLKEEVQELRTKNERLRFFLRAATNEIRKNAMSCEGCMYSDRFKYQYPCRMCHSGEYFKYIYADTIEELLNK